MKKIFTFLFSLCALSINGQYKRGDYYENSDIKGIVVRVDASGEHGLIMSLNRCSMKWLKEKDYKYKTNAFYEDDGEKNMTIVSEFIKDNNLSWSDFPFFEWCRNLGNGWYAPALDELVDILKTINGNIEKKKKNVLRVTYDARNVESISKLIEEHGGDRLSQINPLWMFSSTEADAGKVYTLYFKESTSSKFGGGVAIGAASMRGKWIIDTKSKTTADTHWTKWHGSRAIHKF